MAGSSLRITIGRDSRQASRRLSHSDGFDVAMIRHKSGRSVGSSCRSFAAALVFPQAARWTKSWTDCSRAFCPVGVRSTCADAMARKTIPAAAIRPAPERLRWYGGECIAPVQWTGNETRRPQSQFAACIRFQQPTDSPAGLKIQGKLSLKTPAQTRQPDHGFTRTADPPIG